MAGREASSGAPGPSTLCRPKPTACRPTPSVCRPTPPVQAQAHCAGPQPFFFLSSLCAYPPASPPARFSPLRRGGSRSGRVPSIREPSGTRRGERARCALSGGASTPYREVQNTRDAMANRWIRKTPLSHLMMIYDLLHLGKGRASFGNTALASICECIDRSQLVALPGLQKASLSSSSASFKQVVF